MTIPLIIVLAIAAAILFVGVRYRMLKQMIVMLVVFLIIAAAIGYFKYQGYMGFMAMKDGMMHMKQTVSTTVATSEEWKSTMEAVGSMRAAKGVDLSSEVAGVVQEIHFNSGDDVKEGDLLVKLRADDEIAKLRTLQASQNLAEITIARDKKQFAVKAISQATVDTDNSSLAVARAQLAEQQAIVEKKFIRAPFAGHLGIRNVDLGQYINPGTPIVTLQQMDPIYLDFNLPQQALSQIAPGQKLAVKSDVWPGQRFEGVITAINPKVDTTTRNMAVRAELANKDRKLLPGMYATAEIAVGEARKFVTLPQTAITYNPYGNNVFVVKTAKDDKGEDSMTVEQTIVLTGETRGDQVQVLKGIKEGDTVVSSGQLKLGNGSAILVNNSIAPKNDADPKPLDK